MRKTEHYEIEEHAHRFALWAAARASQRGATGASTKVLSTAFDRSGLRTVFRNAATREWTSHDLDAAHVGWCETLRGSLPPGLDFSFGRAAKFIAIYLKVVFVIRRPDTSFSKHVHPPIDRILLERVGAVLRSTGARQPDASWTKFTPQTYRAALGAVRAVSQADVLWTVERYWHGTVDGD